MSNLMQEAKDAISALYSDMEVDQIITRERLEELVEFIKDMTNALEGE